MEVIDGRGAGGPGPNYREEPGKRRRGDPAQLPAGGAADRGGGGRVLGCPAARGAGDRVALPPRPRPAAPRLPPRRALLLPVRTRGGEDARRARQPRGGAGG